MNFIRLELVGAPACGKTTLANELRRRGVSIRETSKTFKDCHGEIYACGSGVTTVVRHLKELGHAPTVNGRVVRVDLPDRRYPN